MAWSFATLSLYTDSPVFWAKKKKIPFYTVLHRVSYYRNEGNTDMAIKINKMTLNL